MRSGTRRPAQSARAYSGWRASRRLASNTPSTVAEERAGGRPGKGGNCRSNRPGKSRRARNRRIKGAAPTSRDSRRMSSGKAGVVMATSRRATRRTREGDRDGEEASQGEKILAGLDRSPRSPAKIFYPSRVNGRGPGEGVG